MEPGPDLLWWCWDPEEDGGPEKDRSGQTMIDCLNWKIRDPSGRPVAFTLFPAGSKGHLVEVGMEEEWRKVVDRLWTPDPSSIGTAQLFNY